MSFSLDDLQRDEDNAVDEDDEKMKQFASTASMGNGDVRMNSTPTKRAHYRHHHHHHHHHHRSRSRVPQIVLIPEQTRPLPALRTVGRLPTQPELFHSNMFLLEKHLKHLIDRQKNEEDRSEIVNEWKLMALIMDRLLFWLFTALTLLSTIFCLIIIPWLKNAGYISALAKDLMADYKSNGSLTYGSDEQTRMNLSTL